MFSQNHVSRLYAWFLRLHYTYNNNNFFLEYFRMISTIMFAFQLQLNTNELVGPEKIFNISLKQLSMKPRIFFSIIFWKFLKVFPKFIQKFFENLLSFVKIYQKFPTFASRVFKIFFKFPENLFQFSWNFLPTFLQDLSSAFGNTFTFHENFFWLFKKFLSQISFFQNLTKLLNKSD